MPELRRYSLIRPTIQTKFRIDFEWWSQNDRDWRVLLQGLLCPTHQEAFTNSVEDQMVRISPEDEKLIKKFTAMIFGPDILDAASLKPAELSSFSDRIKVIPKILPLFKYFLTESKNTLQGFAASFRDPFMRYAVRFIADGPGWHMPD